MLKENIIQSISPILCKIVASHSNTESIELISIFTQCVDDEPELPAKFTEDTREQFTLLFNFYRNGDLACKEYIYAVLVAVQAMLKQHENDSFYLFKRMWSNLYHHPLQIMIPLLTAIAAPIVLYSYPEKITPLLNGAIKKINNQIVGLSYIQELSKKMIEELPKISAQPALQPIRELQLKNIESAMAIMESSRNKLIEDTLKDTAPKMSAPFAVLSLFFATKKDYSVQINNIMNIIPYDLAIAHQGEIKLLTRFHKQERAFDYLLNQIHGMVEKTPYVFISYAWYPGDKDTPENKELHRRLRHLENMLVRAKCRVFLDIHHMLGIPDQVMQQEIECADIVLLICTPRLIERLNESAAKEATAIAHGLDPKTVEYPIAKEFRLTTEKVSRGGHFRRIPLLFSGAFDKAVPEKVRSNDINHLTLNFTKFFINSGDALIDKHDSYKALAGKTQLFSKIHFLDHRNIGLYLQAYERYKRARSRISYLEDDIVDSDLSDDEALSKHGLTK